MQVKIDISTKLGQYVDPTAWQNSTLRYSPPADFPKFYAETVGTPEIMRTWITLDEYWDYRTDLYYPDYAIGVKRYPDSELHYPYDWVSIVPAPSGIHFKAYLTSHAENAKELLLNVRRLEREVSDGIITYAQYEHVFEKAVEYCKELAPNIRYIECGNEVDIRSFGEMTAIEYYNMYERAYRAVKRLNKKHNYEIPLEIGAWGIAEAFAKRQMWEDFLALLSKSDWGEPPIDFYSVHYYDQCYDDMFKRLPNDKEAEELCAIERFKLYLRRHYALLKELNLPDRPLFLNELGKVRATGELTDNLKNAAGVVTYLISFADEELNHFYMFPWCSFHNPGLQISYTQFVRADDGSYLATPNAIAMILLHKMHGDRVQTTVLDCPAPDAAYRAQAVANEDMLSVIYANPEPTEEDVHIVIEHLESGKYEVREYLCDTETNNCVTGKGSGKLEVTNVSTVETDGTLTLDRKAGRDAFSLIEIVRL